MLDISIQKMFFILPLVSIVVLFSIIFRKKSKIGRQVFPDYIDQNLDFLISKLNQTGSDFMEELLKINNIQKYTVKIKNINHSSASTKIILDIFKIEFGKKFMDILTLDTFESCIHELKHVLDKNICRFKKYTGAIWNISFILILLNYNLSYFDKNFISTNVKILLSILYFISIVLFASIEFITENRAINYVPVYTREILSKKGFDNDDIKKITDYFEYKSKSTTIWCLFEGTISPLILISIFFIFLL